MKEEYNKENKKIIEEIAKKIKEKKELANLDDNFCAEKIMKLVSLSKKTEKKIREAESFEKIKKSKEIKQLVKLARAEIRPIYGLFQTKNIPEAEEIIEKLKKACKENKKESIFKIKSIAELHNKLLEIHVSTKERLGIYKQFFEKIFQITGKPCSILDLGCGFNPMALPYMNLGEKILNENFEYAAVELNQNDVILIKKYFEAIKESEECKNINAEAIKLNLEEETEKIPKKEYDICLALKIFDIIGAKTTEKIVNSVNCKWIAASFPTKTITTRQMRFKRRAGFQKMLRRLGKKYETIAFENELVYVIKLR